jgi:mono/diheme cytochrome c family protein
MGRSAFMPPWGQELTDEQIRDVVYYLSVINVNNKSAAKK